MLYLLAYHISQLLDQITIAFTRYQIEGIYLQSILLLFIYCQLLLLRLHFCLLLVFFDVQGFFDFLLSLCSLVVDKP